MKVEITLLPQRAENCQSFSEKFAKFSVGNAFAPQLPGPSGENPLGKQSSPIVRAILDPLAGGELARPLSRVPPLLNPVNPTDAAPAYVPAPASGSAAAGSWASALAWLLQSPLRLQ